MLSQKGGAGGRRCSILVENSEKVPYQSHAKLANAVEIDLVLHINMESKMAWTEVEQRKF